MTESAPATALGKKLSRFGLLVIAFFMLGFPVAGILFFWNDMQKKLHNSVDEFVATTHDEFIKSIDSGNYDAEDASVNFRAWLKEGGWTDLEAKYGQYVSSSDWKVTQTWAREENDMAIQYSHVLVPFKFEKQDVLVEFKLMRMTAAPRWRYDALKVLDKPGQ